MRDSDLWNFQGVWQMLEVGGGQIFAAKNHSSTVLISWHRPPWQQETRPEDPREVPDSLNKCGHAEEY